MDDTVGHRPDGACLFGTASGQHGYFTARQARLCGFGTSLIAYHYRRGRFVRAHRGVYRLRDYPSSPEDEVVAAWLAVGKDEAVVSHESALDLLGLSDVIPNAIHLTVPRSRRYLPTLPGVRLHTTTKPFLPVDVTTREGIRLTSVSRTIVDAAEWGTGPEQVEMAVRQAIAWGMTTPRRLERALDGRSKRVQSLIVGALRELTG